MAMQADIDLAATLAPSTRRNRIWSGRRAGLRRGLDQRVQHVLPGGERREHPAVEGAADGLDAVAGGGVHLVGLFIEAAEQTLAQRRGGPAMRASARARRSAASAMSGPSGRGRIPVPAAGLVSRGARQHLMADQVQEGLGGVGPASVQPAQFGMVRADPALPAGCGQRSRRLQGGVQRRLQLRPGCRRAPRSAAEAARTRSAALGTQQPATHSAVSRPDSSAANALSAASNTWWPSSNT